MHLCDLSEVAEIVMDAIACSVLCCVVSFEAFVECKNVCIDTNSIGSVALTNNDVHSVSDKKSEYVLAIST